MARPGLMRHRKFIRLARELGSKALARGYLEIIWEACYESGDARLGTAADVEFLAGWEGQANRFACLLLESGFLDLLEDGEYQVHDLFDHAPEYVRKRMEREKERQSKGKTLSEVRAKAGRKGGRARVDKTTQANGKQTEANEFRLLPGEEANGGPPSPSPSPSPSLIPGEGPKGFAFINRPIDSSPGPIDNATELAQEYAFIGGDGTSAPCIARARVVMVDLLKAGFTRGQIGAEIKKPGRTNSEHPGTFCRRLMKGKADAVDPFAAFGPRVVESGISTPNDPDD